MGIHVPLLLYRWSCSVCLCENIIITGPLCLVKYGRLFEVVCLLYKLQTNEKVDVHINTAKVNQKRLSYIIMSYKKYVIKIPTYAPAECRQ